MHLARLLGASVTGLGCQNQDGQEFSVTGSGHWQFTGTAGGPGGVVGTFHVTSMYVSGPCTFRLTGSTGFTWSDNSSSSVLYLGSGFGSIAGASAQVAAQINITAVQAAYDPIFLIAP